MLLQRGSLTAGSNFSEMQGWVREASDFNLQKILGMGCNFPPHGV